MQNLIRENPQKVNRLLIPGLQVANLSRSALQTFGSILAKLADTKEDALKIYQDIANDRKAAEKFTGKRPRLRMG